MEDSAHPQSHRNEAEVADMHLSKPLLASIAGAALISAGAAAGISGASASTSNGAKGASRPSAPQPAFEPASNVEYTAPAAAPGNAPPSGATGKSGVPGSGTMPKGHCPHMGGTGNSGSSYGSSEGPPAGPAPTYQ